MLKQNLLHKVILDHEYILYCYDILTSTIDIAFTLPFKSCVLAKKQTYGIGQYGRKWDSCNGDNMLFSMHIANYIDIAEANEILSNISLITLSQYTQKEFIKKYPNDIYYDGRKICGVISHYRQSTVLSVGMNLNSSIDNAIDLSKIVHSPINVIEFVKKWINNYIQYTI